ncbi:MAG: hypothetical protein ABUL60_26545, partial [Myxococcales bacterium]
MRQVARVATIALLSAIVVSSVLAIGTVHTSVLLIVAIAASICAATAVLSGGRVSASPLVWVLLGLMLLTLVQAVPLPWAILSRCAPQNADIWAGERALFGLDARAAA